MVVNAHETKTKIVCTIGPACKDPNVLSRMIREGMDVARINFSHGTCKDNLALIDLVRRVAEQENATVAVLADLQGPKLRIGRLAEPVDLRRGDWVSLTTGPADGRHHVIPLPHPELITGAKVGERLLFDDGLIETVVREVRPETLVADVVIGGRLDSNKGIAAPGSTGRLSALSDKDRSDAVSATRYGVDFIALSFVQTSEDVQQLRAHIDQEPGGAEVAIVAKIEKREALEHLDEILDVSDAIMVARGDLGIEVPPQNVPFYQKEIIRRCNRIGVPVITATQMLQSMVDHLRPTRAEASDVANAILDGTDAVMLSAETAVGDHPVDAVAMMREISAIAEMQMRSRFDDVPFASVEHVHPITDAISDATARIAADLDARLIAVSTVSGYTARQIARERPREPIVAMTPTEHVSRQLAMVWGVTPMLVPLYNGTDDMLKTLSRVLLDSGSAERGDIVVVSAGIPSGVLGKTNFIKVHRI